MDVFTLILYIFWVLRQSNGISCLFVVRHDWDYPCSTGSESVVLVTENDQPVGIFSEEDLFKSLLEKKSAAFSEIKLKNAMTRNLLLAKPQDPITTVLAKMIASDLNYLPVIEEKKIIGILTLKDMMKHQIDVLIDEIHQLKDYIADLHEAGQD